MFVATPIGLFSAIYLARNSPANRLRRTVKPLMEILAGIPTVVYDSFAHPLVVAPALRKRRHGLWVFRIRPKYGPGGRRRDGDHADSVHLLALRRCAARGAGVPCAKASLALGATKAETITKVLLLAALPGMSWVVFSSPSAVPKIGETMIVVMGGRTDSDTHLQSTRLRDDGYRLVLTLLIGEHPPLTTPKKPWPAFGLGPSCFMCWRDASALTCYRPAHASRSY